MIPWCVMHNFCGVTSPTPLSGLVVTNGQLKTSAMGFMGHTLPIQLMQVSWPTWSIRTLYTGLINLSVKKSMKMVIGTCTRMGNGKRASSIYPKATELFITTARARWCTANNKLMVIGIISMKVLGLCKPGSNILLASTKMSTTTVRGNYNTVNKRSRVTGISLHKAVGQCKQASKICLTDELSTTIKMGKCSTMNNGSTATGTSLTGVVVPSRLVSKD